MNTDVQFMKVALEEAQKAYDEGNYPCGAALVVNGEIIDQAHNLKEAKSDRISHAEMLLYIANSSKLKKSKKEGAEIIMYTTLEPCLMCFGAAAIHRVDKVVASSPDPFGDMSSIKGDALGSFYRENLPKLEYGVCFEDTYELTRKFLEEKGDSDSLKLLELLSQFREKFS